ncbi:KAT8 regulatory NSL complex subunit 1-like protein [Centropristis striata]|uniref:KAT8 regulatory NSL complex subunit 1-like protein n=1 Tax=Centropristis striata TaxID=184440 RepID=UPI0027E01288|nr:KAT8 regulatory NSL complex subunit 1-like protein [Centropristis striata]
MAPALTKILKDVHGAHLSSPPVRVDVDLRTLQSPDLESHMRLTDDGDLQKMWLNLSLFPSLDSGVPLSPLDVPANPVVSPLPQTSALLGLLSFNKARRHSQQVACVFPGVPDMFFIPVPEHKSQEASELHRRRAAAAECGPGGGDVFLHQDLLSQSCSPPPLIQGGAAAGICPPPLVRGKVDSVLDQVSRQAELQIRGQRLQRRLQVLLGEHALLHCSQQLEGLQRHWGQLGDVSLDSLDSVGSVRLAPLAGSRDGGSWVERSDASSSVSEIREFSRCSRALLRDLQEVLDSEATASSSSEEEQEEVQVHRRTKTSQGCERRWLEERAELGSRWSWLQLRLSELEGKIQQLVELHTHIRSTKGGVVLADSQPLTDRQIQQSLLREMAGLSCTASDADSEPYSPTRLLHNIERQSAQLSQIVNSLMTPLSFSPLSKPHNSWKGKRAFTSGQKGDDVFGPGSSKRRRPGTRRLFKADVSCVCARTRPLVTYHKPTLFTINTHNPSRPEGKSSSTVSSSLSSSSCSCGSSYDPVVLCSDQDCSFRRTRSSSTPHPASSLSFDTRLSHHIKRLLAREQWSQRPLVVNVQPASQQHYNTHSSTPLHNSQKYKRHARHDKSRVLGLSPIRVVGSAQTQHRRTSQRKRKRRRVHRLIEEEEDVLSQLCDPDTSDEVLEESCTQASHKQSSQGFVRKRQGESVFNINNIVIPVSLTKVEKLQYKDILTPSWRVVDVSEMTRRTEEEEDEEGQVEDLTNQVFSQRHEDLERRERLRWPSWGKRKDCRQQKRSCVSRLSASGGGVNSSGEESSVESQLDEEQQSSEDLWLPQTPWEPRAFPLSEDEEEALLCDDPEGVPSGWSECSSASSTAKNYNSHLLPAPSSGAAAPPGGQSHSSTHSS